MVPLVHAMRERMQTLMMPHIDEQKYMEKEQKHNKPFKSLATTFLCLFLFDSWTFIRNILMKYAQ